MTAALFFAGLALVAILTAGAAAVHSVSRIWMRHWVEQRLSGTGAPVMSIEGVQRLLLAAGTSVALVAFATGAVLGTTLAQRPFVLAERVLVAALLVLVAGQLIPRAIGRRWAAQLVPALVPLLGVLAALLAPLVSAAQALARLTGRKPAPAPEPSNGRDALEDLLREGELEGVGDAGESAIITGVVEFSTKCARDVMTPRSEMFTLDCNAEVADLASKFAHARYSRVPIVDGSVDRVVGMLHAFDLLKYESGPRPPLRPVAFALEDAPANDLLSRMLRERVHMAIVQDDAGRTVGLLTLEDLIEELVGDIRDEHDEPTG